MRDPIRHAVLAALVLLPACGGVNTLDPNDPSSPNYVPKVCQQGEACCTPEELTCRGNPDGTMVCTCYKDWTCDSALSPQKCQQNPADTPDGKSGWKCVVRNGKDVCTRSGTEVPPGKNGWVCTQTATGVKCERTMNTPDGAAGWGCQYVADIKVCTKTKPADLGVPKTDSGLPPPPPPKPDSGVIPPPVQWNCYKDGVNGTVCTRSGGFPPGGAGWKCYWKNGTITCEGTSSTPPGGSGWTCVKNELAGHWVCTKPAETPPGGGTWNCVSSSDQGTICYQPPTPKSGQECIPGQKMWCDGVLYCGYGQVVCGPDGKWKTRANGELDCTELPSGVRPNTVCACYFFYFNKDCCETPDCLVPPGTNGAVCPPSPGGFCDYCNPQKPECTGTGAKCILSSKKETFCAQSCAGGKACPTGSMCTAVTSGGVTSMQCIPFDQSCYY
jgi:hypothetical protein